MKPFIIIFGIVLLISTPGLCTIIHIPGDYPTIQEGINEAQNGDTILVAVGTYYENIIINKSLVLQGEDKDNTIIDGSGHGDVVLIEADRVYIGLFNIRNSGTDWNDSGVEISHADSCNIEQCSLHDNYNGLHLYGSSYNVISRCHISLNSHGILFNDPPYPGPFVDNMDNIIQNNILHSNTICGILFEHTGAIYHRSNVIQGNSILYNVTGISIIMSQENDISNNDIIGNTGYGMNLQMCMGGGELNRIYQNNYYLNNGNSVQGCEWGGGCNYWFSEEDSAGNYWSDYTGKDTNEDGIGDVPYIVDGDSTCDDYPLMIPLYSTVEGRVTDTNSAPIEGVQITVAGIPIDYYTDINGDYSIDSLGAGICDISFTHPAFSDTTILDVAVTPGYNSRLDVIMNIYTNINKHTKENSMHHTFSLSQNYPNPFNSVTSICYTLVEESRITLKLYDLKGRHIRTLVDRQQEAGQHTVHWDGKNHRSQPVTSGIYIYSIITGNYKKSSKMHYIK